MFVIKNSEKLILDNNEVPVSKEMLMGLLNVEVELDEKLTVGELVHLFYSIRDFVNIYFAEEYEAVRSLITMGKFSTPILKIDMFKGIEDNDGNFYTNNTLKLVPSEDGFLDVKSLTINLQKQLSDVDELLKEKINAKFKLIDVMEVIFVDFVYLLREGAVLQ